VSTTSAPPSAPSASPSSTTSAAGQPAADRRTGPSRRAPPTALVVPSHDHSSETARPKAATHWWHAGRHPRPWSCRLTTTQARRHDPRRPRWHADHRARPPEIAVPAPVGWPAWVWHADHRARPPEIAVPAPVGWPRWLVARRSLSPPPEIAVLDQVGWPAWVWHGDLRSALGTIGVLRQMPARPRTHRSCTGAGQAVRALTWARSEGRCSGQTQQLCCASGDLVVHKPYRRRRRRCRCAGRWASHRPQDR